MMHFSAPRDSISVNIPSRPGASSTTSAGALLVKPVADHHQRRAASLLVRRMYAWRGYLTDKITDRLDDPNRVALAAWQDDDLIATLAVGRDSHHGLLSEALYAREVESLRGRGRTICEFSRFAVDPEFSSRNLLLTLFAAAHHYAHAIFAATDALIEVNPRHARFYEREFGFQQIGELRLCPRVDAPAVLMHRDLGLPVGALT